ncbi:MAG: hypothetical protein OJJ21_22320 [Ferrovibrio sp.]|uniref:hypothetical protein n=1 Tax=Ferrovibrio sp. TaxID=1917215 RepID=UPI0026191AB7|nr:hypothetical protein [Ferrovibrio sp.]MCW0236350.1 hypothetical protein [Ferrovibrio sp.]
MYEISHYLSLGSPDAPEQPIEVLPLPTDPDSLLMALEAALDKAAAEYGQAVRIFGAVVPVVSDGPPSNSLVASIAWLAGQGRYRAIHDFRYDAHTDLHPIVDRISAMELGVPEPGADAMTGGVIFRR